jgi:uncharacterized protein
MPEAPGTGSLAFTEFASAEPAATRRFLEKVFGWTFRSVKMPMGEYLAYETPGAGRGGIRPLRADENAHSIAYVRVEDLDAALVRVQRAGGTIVLPRVDVPGMGSFFWFRVPGGPLLACWQDLPATPNASEEPR